MADKQELREATWAALQASGDARFPGTRGRIPNFRGAEAAARRLAQTDVFQRAHVLKCNPDSPQRPVRQAALEAGKTVFLAVPKLAEAKPFLRLDPTGWSRAEIRRAATIKGAGELGEPVGIDEMPPIDLIVTGCVAVTRDGARLGKGGGYSDLEYGLLREAGLVDADTPVVTTVHPSQLLDALPMAAHDVSLDQIALPDELIVTERPYPRPTGILDRALSDDKRAAIPALRSR